MRTHCLGALLIASCVDPAPNRVEYDDAARLVGATIATAHGGATVGAVNDSMMLAFGDMPWGFNFDGSAITGTHGGLAHRYLMVFCRDRHNQVLKPCPPLTNTATIVASWEGSISGQDLELQSARQGMWTLGNLQTWMPSITGSSALQMQGFVDDRKYALTATEAETMVTPSPLIGGSIRLELVVTRLVDDPIELELGADVVFDDLVHTAELVLDGEHTYRIHLATGEVE